MITHNILNRVPGTTKPSKEIYVQNLSTYTMVQLCELRDRQLKLLQNKSRVAKLPDRGERITIFQDRILKEIHRRNEIDEAAAKFSDLNIASEGIKAVTALEWSSGKSTQPPSTDTVMDSDDDEDVDPLKILAQHRGVKVVKVAKAEESLITPADLAEIASFTTDKADHTKHSEYTQGPSLEPHAVYMCGIDAKNKDIKQKFKPYKTTVSNVHDVDKEKSRKLGPHWEVTAATPPILRNSEPTVLTLKESIEIQRQQFEKWKVIQEQHTYERLQARQKIVADNLELLPPGSSDKDPGEFFKTYRAHQAGGNDSEDDEFCDTVEYGDEDEDRGGVSIPFDD